MFRSCKKNCRLIGELSTNLKVKYGKQEKNDFWSFKKKSNFFLRNKNWLQRGSNFLQRRSLLTYLKVRERHFNKWKHQWQHQQTNLLFCKERDWKRERNRSDFKYRVAELSYLNGSLSVEWWFVGGVHALSVAGRKVWDAVELNLVPTLWSLKKKDFNKLTKTVTINRIGQNWHKL